VTVLERLAESDHRPGLVVTPPDRPRGRGRHVGPPPAAAAARGLGIELVQTADINSGEAPAALRQLGPDVVVVCAFGQIIREPLLSEHLMLNVHPSLLPRWRGAAPIERAIMAGDAETGVSVPQVTAGLDSGPVALLRSVAIASDDDYGSLAAKLAVLGGELMVEALDLQARGALELTEQDDSAATYAEKITAEDRRLDPGRAAEELSRAIRALSPHIGAYLELEDGLRLGVKQARPVAGDLATGELRADTAEGKLLVGCRSGSLRLEVVQPAGGKPMAAADFLRGHRLPDRVKVAGG
jgi:methionyl-tRNA formyltransferase